MDFETIVLSIDGPVAVITLNRPDKLNAINAVMLHELDAALDHLEQDDSIYSIVVNGNGRAFCAGFDLKAGSEANRQGEEEWRLAIEADLKIIMRFWHSPKPTVAVVHGYVLAGGFELALACDMTVSETNALFGEPEVRFGSSIAVLLLPWFTNPKRAKKMLLTGQDRMAAEEALSIGIINEVVDEGNGLQRGVALAKEVALMDPDSVRLTKKAINQTYETMGLSAALQMGANTSIEIETLETDLRQQFNQVLKEDGLKAAIAWRENRIISKN